MLLVRILGSGYIILHYTSIWPEVNILPEYNKRDLAKRRHIVAIFSLLELDIVLGGKEMRNLDSHFLKNNLASFSKVEYATSIQLFYSWFPCKILVYECQEARVNAYNYNSLCKNQEQEMT